MDALVGASLAVDVGSGLHFVLLLQNEQTHDAHDDLDDVLLLATLFVLGPSLDLLLDLRLVFLLLGCQVAVGSQARLEVVLFIA